MVKQIKRFQHTCKCVYVCVWVQISLFCCIGVRNRAVLLGSRFGHIHHLFSQAHHGSIVLASPANHMLRAVMCMPYNINHFQLRTVATSNDKQAKVENVITHLSIISKREHNSKGPIKGQKKREGGQAIWGKKCCVTVEPHKRRTIF